MCLYIGDIGDNDYEREYISIYKVKEPELNFVDQETRDWEVFHFQYPNEKFNAESMLIDAITRELVIGKFTKIIYTNLMLNNFSLSIFHYSYQIRKTSSN